MLFAGSHIQKSPFTVNVKDCPVNPDNVVAKGPGLQPGNTVGNPTHFDVITTGIYWVCWLLFKVYSRKYSRKLVLLPNYIVLANLSL